MKIDITTRGKAIQFDIASSDTQGEIFLKTLAEEFGNALLSGRFGAKVETANGVRYMTLILSGDNPDFTPDITKKEGMLLQ